MGSLTLQEALLRLTAGELVIFPTETVYGLGADALNERAVKKIFEVKNRPLKNPLIIHLAHTKQILDYAFPDDRLEKLDSFFPGPLTVVLKARPSILADCVTAGLPTVAVRIPKHPIAHALLREFGRPIAAPSANPSGLLSPTGVEQLKLPVPYLPGDFSEVGIESSIVDLSTSESRLLRAGGIPAPDLVKALDVSLDQFLQPITDLKAPGALLRHYTPEFSMILNTSDPIPCDAVLGFGKGWQPVEKPFLNLSPRESLEEAAHNLFSFLFQLQRPEIRTVAVHPIPEEGLGLAINDRLRRGAHR